MVSSNKNVHTMIVSTFNKERKEFMETQLKSLQFPFPYAFFKAYTQFDTSNTYIDTIQDHILDDTKRYFSLDRSIALKHCLRSHIAALHECLQSSSASYFLILEDDVAFRTDINIKHEINRHIEFLESNPNIHYISLSYRPTADGNPISEIIKKEHSNEDIYWNFDPTLIWGTQAYLLHRDHAQKLVSLLHVDKISILVKRFKEYYESTAVKYSSRQPQLLIDSVLPIVLNQAIIYPMMGIEKMFSHSISCSKDVEASTNEYYNTIKLDYYNYK
jgi:GR25 family glycosyltransferase involved in LPS biosynthesis